MNKYLVIAGIIFISFSCKDKNKVTKYYYDNGNLKSEVFFVSDSIGYLKKYSEKGNLIQEGTLLFDSIMDGHYNYFYADGQIWWQGKIKNNVIQDSCKWRWLECIKDKLKRVEIEGNPQELVVGNTYKFRLIMPEIHPQFYAVFGYDYQNIENHDIDDPYPYMFKCTENTGNSFVLMFMNRDGHFIIGNPEYHFFITPSKENKITALEEFGVGDTLSLFIQRTRSDGIIDTVQVYR